jgi:hypothetical protein
MMFERFRRKKTSASDSAQLPTDPVLRKGVDAMVALLFGDPSAGDDAIVGHLTADGLSERQATRIVQFVPIAFTRFLYRSHGIRFAPNYVVLDAQSQPVAQRPIADEPAYREAWNHCVQAHGAGAGEDYFVAIAARSGGYQAIQELIQKGSNLRSVVTGPPCMFE